MYRGKRKTDKWKITLVINQTGQDRTGQEERMRVVKQALKK